MTGERKLGHRRSGGRQTFRNSPVRVIFGRSPGRPPTDLASVAAHSSPAPLPPRALLLLPPCVRPAFTPRTPPSGNLVALLPLFRVTDVVDSRSPRCPGPASPPPACRSSPRPRPGAPPYRCSTALHRRWAASPAYRRLMRRPVSPGSTRPPSPPPRPRSWSAAAASAGPTGWPRTAPSRIWRPCWPPPTRRGTTWPPGHRGGARRRAGPLSAPRRAPRRPPGAAGRARGVREQIRPFLRDLPGHVPALAGRRPGPGRYPGQAGARGGRGAGGDRRRAAATRPEPAGRAGDRGLVTGRVTRATGRRAGGPGPGKPRPGKGRSSPYVPV